MPEYYSALTETVQAIASGYGIDVSVEVVYTDAMRSEAVMFADQCFIIYDRYAGQVTNMMNRLFLYGASRRTKLIYFHKLISQILSRYGFYEESGFAARRYQQQRHEMDHQKRQAEAGSNRHALYTVMQEMYVMLHELTHVLLRQDAGLKELLHDDVAQWLRDFAERNASKDMGLRAAGHFSEILARADLMEEFCCDRFAGMILPDVLVRLFGVNQASGVSERGAMAEERVKSVVLCLLNLRTVQLLEARCSAESRYDFNDRVEGPSILDSMYATFYTARVHHGKECCYETLKIEADKLELLHADVTRLMADHSDEILCPALQILSLVMYDREVRESMAAEFDLIRKNLLTDAEDNRLITSILHYVSPTGGDDGG